MLVFLRFCFADGSYLILRFFERDRNYMYNISLLHPVDNQHHNFEILSSDSNHFQIIAFGIVTGN